MRPAWAHSCGCKSHRKLVIASEEKRNCDRTEMGRRRVQGRSSPSAVLGPCTAIFGTDCSVTRGHRSVKPC
ncbi:hypothetical protein CWR43_31850 [Rhizobium sullae]|uniref:Uncharacterized protein n=1 Tax=Rhizobium sullae TaxID=50338 RepID=A0A2N0D144_RHISU|nr:hypothetical protein CWR43_31850 [Rhizobium sullae]